MTDEDMGRISSLKQQGKSAAAIAEMLDLPANTVKSYLRRHPGTEDAHACPQCGKEYWKSHEFTEEQRMRLSEKKKAYWNDPETSDAHRQKLSRLMKEMRAGETAAGKEGQNG